MHIYSLFMAPFYLSSLQSLTLFADFSCLKFSRLQFHDTGLSRSAFHLSGHPFVDSPAALHLHVCSPLKSCHSLQGPALAPFHFSHHLQVLGHFSNSDSFSAPVNSNDVNVLLTQMCLLHSVPRSDTGNSKPNIRPTPVLTPPPFQAWHQSPPVLPQWT